MSTAANSNGNGKLNYTKSSRFQLPALDISSASLTAGTSIPPPLPSPPPAVPEKPKPTLSRPTALKLSSTTSPPQTPNAVDSPNPLRSHPTSSHSLNRQLSPQADSPSVIGTAQGASPFSSASPGNPKRIHSNSTPESPPTKRPMSVRKLLSLRALNSAFNRDSQLASPASAKSESHATDSKVYSNGDKSSDNLSMFSFRPSTSMSTGRPTLKKRRSSAFWGRRGSSFFGGAVQEEIEDDEETKNNAKIADEKRDPPPMLPALERLGAGRDLKEGDGGFLGGGDMFRDIK